MQRFSIELRSAITPIVFAARSVRGLGVVAGRFYDARPSIVRGGITISVNGGRCSGTICPDRYLIPVNDAAVEMLRLASLGFSIKRVAPIDFALAS